MSYIPSWCETDIPKISSNNRALTSLHVGRNKIPEKEMREIMAIAVHMDSMKILCEVPFKDKALTALDVSGKNLGMEGALVVAEYLDGNRTGAMTSLNLANNHIEEEDIISPPRQGLQKGDIVDGKTVTTIYVRHYNNGNIRVTDFSGILAVAKAIKDMRALTKFDISSNDIRAEGGKALAAGLQGNQAITELNISYNDLAGQDTDTSGIIAIANAIPDMGAMSSFTFSGDYQTNPVTMDISMTEADFSGKGLGLSGAIMLSAFHMYPGAPTDVT
jgi:hypothetical protein